MGFFLCFSISLRNLCSFYFHQIFIFLPLKIYFLLRNKFTFKKSHNHFVFQLTRKEQKFKPSPPENNPLPTECEKDPKPEHGFEAVTGSEEILNVFQISFPVSRYWMTQIDWSHPNGHNDAHQKSDSVYTHQFYQKRRGAFKHLYSNIKICQHHHCSKDEQSSPRQYLGWQCIYMNM